MTLATMPMHTLIIGGVLAFVVLLFLTLFLVPALYQSWKLGRFTKRLIAADSTDLDALSAIFKKDDILGHLWEEFRDTLHEQKDLDASGTYKTTAIRQTVPAETYFSEQMLVHSPLRTEFFKHLPGILTGIGIIGTFSGLIAGLQAFNVSDNPDDVRRTLNDLLKGVGQAFLISATSITLAMVVTFIEKWLVSGLYKKVERLCLALDTRFDAGAGEEYLSRLVHASEASAKEAKQLKQSLVNDLKQILETVAERQIQAQNATTAGIAKEIVAGLNESLREPLSEIGAAVKHVSGNQSDAINNLLTDTMAAMTAQIRDLFSGQVDGIRGMQQQTIDSLGIAVGRLEQLVGDISDRGKQTTDAMSTQLASTLASMDERQRAMNEQTQALVDTMRSQVAQSQQDATMGMQQAIDRMSAAVSEIAKSLQANIESASVRDDQRSRQLAEHTTAATNSAANVTKELIHRTAEAISTMRQAVESMRSGTADTVTKMNLGAADMLKAANEMARAGSTTSTALDRAQRLADQLGAASSALTDSTSMLNRAIDDYKTTRDTLAIMIEQLKATVDHAKREASLTADILQRIEAATQSLRDAQLQADKYLHGVSDVLTNAHQQFGTQIISTLNNVNGEFHRHVERGTKALGGAIDELEQVLDRVGGT
ncbi:MULTISPECIES: anti-phage ZorAB system protein ZorA [Hydrocarboniphaga]|jgi:hypothetical protein|uniref:anti-phage ZorAB system protein ZorA n=1 Tax=Hydrocarboniphaga TaxID=243627 RepID=UPI002AB82CBA|nr:anti-phage ZorAB system protein ZorA [Hydrocarboniphaga sp.]MDZ4078510.1 anti-phage ZorAB system protein ZorA [Hydrocarboniphaga sp.]